jgi:hypothetical protein
MKVKVVRALCIAGERQEPGTVIELPDVRARELIWIGKVEAVGDKPVASGPMTTETVSAVVAGKKGGAAAGGK